MSRDKSGKKSGWKKRDRQYQQEQSQKAATNRRKALRPAIENILAIMAPPAPKADES